MIDSKIHFDGGVRRALGTKLLQVGYAENGKSPNMMTISG